MVICVLLDNFLQIHISVCRLVNCEVEFSPVSCDCELSDSDSCRDRHTNIKLYLVVCFSISGAAGHCCVYSVCVYVCLTTVITSYWPQGERQPLLDLSLCLFTSPLVSSSSRPLRLLCVCVVQPLREQGHTLVANRTQGFGPIGWAAYCVPLLA